MEKLGIRLSELPTKLNLKLKLGLAIYFSQFKVEYSGVKSKCGLRIMLSFLSLIIDYCTKYYVIPQRRPNP